eukprot:753713-Pelagomonas_calceolata.AAC.1
MTSIERRKEFCGCGAQYGLAGAPSLLTDMAQILECRPTFAQLLANRLGLACCVHGVHGYWADALNWLGTAGFLL